MITIVSKVPHDEVCPENDPLFVDHGFRGAHQHIEVVLLPNERQNAIKQRLRIKTHFKIDR